MAEPSPTITPAIPKAITDQQKQDVAEMSKFETSEEMTGYFDAQLALITPPTVAAYQTRLTELKNMAMASDKYDLVNSTDIYEKTKENLEQRQDLDKETTDKILSVVGQVLGAIATAALGVVAGGTNPLLSVLMTDTNSIGSGGVSGVSNGQGTGMGV